MKPPRLRASNGKWLDGNMQASSRQLNRHHKFPNTRTSCAFSVTVDSLPPQSSLGANPQIEADLCFYSPTNGLNDESKLQPGPSSVWAHESRHQTPFFCNEKADNASYTRIFRILGLHNCFKLRFYRKPKVSETQRPSSACFSKARHSLHHISQGTAGCYGSHTSNTGVHVFDSRKGASDWLPHSESEYSSLSSSDVARSGLRASNLASGSPIISGESEVSACTGVEQQQRTQSNINPKIKADQVQPTLTITVDGNIPGLAAATISDCIPWTSGPSHSLHFQRIAQELAGSPQPPPPSPPSTHLANDTRIPSGGANEELRGKHIALPSCVESQDGASGELHTARGVAKSYAKTRAAELGVPRVLSHRVVSRRQPSGVAGVCGGAWEGRRATRAAVPRVLSYRVVAGGKRGSLDMKAIKNKEAEGGACFGGIESLSEGRRLARRLSSAGGRLESSVDPAQNAEASSQDCRSGSTPRVLSHRVLSLEGNPDVPERFQCAWA